MPREPGPALFRRCTTWEGVSPAPGARVLPAEPGQPWAHQKAKLLFHIALRICNPAFKGRFVMNSLFSCIWFVYVRKEDVWSVRTFNHDFALKPGLLALLLSCQLVPGEHSGSTPACAWSWGVFGKPQRLCSGAHCQVTMPSQCPSSPLVSVVLFIVAWRPETWRCSTSCFSLGKGFVIWVDKQLNTRTRVKYSESTKSMRGHLPSALPINKQRRRRGDEFLLVLRF